MQHHDKLSSTAASMRKKIKTHLKPKAHNKLVNVKNNIQKRSLQPQCVTSQHEIPRRFAAPMSNISTIANAPVVVDLTLDNESDDPIIEVQPPSTSAPKPSSSSRNPKGSYNRVWIRPVTPPVNDHMSILKTISESPKVKKSTGILPAAPFVDSSRNFTLPATLLAQTSPSFKLGSINNPITID
ncbi:hypothetical protein BDN70DRAFT_574003 [Pholiota conissans]|uniref:Uncharacterized protein n=1 Tax=Pholiota conissans TaxID=109636 RepID=A0A9P5Z4N8_9AGAR|nr:hypothetical protein BDN70DRAFT_574003 [Pholiota conissans]